MIKIVQDEIFRVNISKDKPIGSTFIVNCLGKDHIVLKSFNSYISLTDPNITWSHSVILSGHECDIELRLINDKNN